MNSTLAAKVGGGAVILTGTGVGGAYIATKDSFWNQVKEICLNEGLDEKDNAWSLAKDKLTKTDSAPKTEEFKSLKTKIISITEEQEKTKEFRNKCIEIYGQTFKNAFGSSAIGEDLISDLKAFCSLTIKEKIGENKLLEKSSEEAIWKKAQDKLDTVISENKSSLTKKFKETYETLKGVQVDNDKKTKGTYSKDVCEEIYSLYYQSTIEAELINQTSKFCSWTIGEQLTDSKIFKKHTGTGEDGDQTKLKALLTSLASHADNTTKGNLENTKLKTLKDDNNRADKWKELKDWCINHYQLIYKGANDNDWKLADNYCKKTD